MNDSPSKRYIFKLRRELRLANDKVFEFDRKWSQINDEINDLMDRQDQTDIVQRNKIKSASLPLADALGAGNWWRAKAAWLANSIQAEIAADKFLQDER